MSKKMINNFPLVYQLKNEFDISNYMTIYGVDPWLLPTLNLIL